MRRYSASDEERIHTQGLVREWTRAGLLDATQGERLGAELRVDLRRTNPFLRAGLALFTALITAATVGLFIVGLALRDDFSTSLITGIAAFACFGLAEYLIRAFRCYRFGVEEALAVASVVLLAISGAELASSLRTWLSRVPEVVALLTGAAGGFGLYRRFGFVYAAFGSIVCAAAVPFQLDLPASLQRVLAAAVIASVFAAVRSQRLKHRDDRMADEYGPLQAAAFAGVYLVLNVQIVAGWYTVDGLFYWCTYVAIWVLPLIGLRLGIRERDRELMDVSLALALITLVTNKSYLGWPRYTWDPIAFGMVLIAIAVALRRWLSMGPGGERDGFTSSRLLDKDHEVLSVIRTASAFAQPGIARRVAPSPAEPAAPDFGGGRSGGGGGGDSF
jgi:hypothetical protein